MQIVEPSQENYKQVYLQDQNYYFFNLNNGLIITGEIQQYQIDTDVSLMPYSDVRSELIATVPQLLRAKSKAVTVNEYAQIMFTKSSTSTKFTRSFNKIDDYFSYVGGLMGTVLLFFFMLSGYSEKSYLADIAFEVFKPSEDSDQSPSFHFLHYLAVNIKQIFNSLSINFQWKQPDTFIDCLEEMEKQLSIEYIFNRMNYFQEAVSSLLSEQQLEVLFLNERKTIKEVETIRKKHSLFERLISQLQRKQSNSDLNESSCKIKDPKHNQVSNLSIPIEEVPKQPKVEFINQQLNSESMSDGHDQEIESKIKQKLVQIISESKSGNQISARILSKTSKKVVSELGLTAFEQKKIPQQLADQKPQEGQQPDPFQYLT